MKINSDHTKRKGNHYGTKSMLTSNRIPIYAHRILGSLGCKHGKSLERNVWRKVVFSSKAVKLDKESAFSL